MITHLLAVGLFGTAPDPGAGTGDIVATAGRTVTLLLAPGTGVPSSTLPIGAPSFIEHLDPGDRRPFAIDFSAFLPGETKIADIAELAISATGAQLGVKIDDSAGRLPIIDETGKIIQFWLLVDAGFQANAGFLATGLKVGVAARIQTDADPYEEIERTAVATVRQQ